MAFISGNEPYQACKQNVCGLLGQAPSFQEEVAQLQCFAREPSIYDFQKLYSSLTLVSHGKPLLQIYKGAHICYLVRLAT